MAARILIADDDQVLQRLLLHTLKMEGYEVLTARDGNDALAVIGRERPDLVILDVMMPGHQRFRALPDPPQSARDAHAAHHHAQRPLRRAGEGERPAAPAPTNT